MTCWPSPPQPTTATCALRSFAWPSAPKKRMLRSNLSMVCPCPVGQGQAARGKPGILGFNGCNLLRQRSRPIGPGKAVKTALREHEGRIGAPTEPPAHVRYEFIQSGEIGVGERGWIRSGMRMAFYETKAAVVSLLDEPAARGVGQLRVVTRLDLVSRALES